MIDLARGGLLAVVYLLWPAGHWHASAVDRSGPVDREARPEAM